MAQVNNEKKLSKIVKQNSVASQSRNINKIIKRFVNSKKVLAVNNDNNVNIGVLLATKTAINKWQRLDLNQRPRAYESPALPLSYAA